MTRESAPIPRVAPVHSLRDGEGEDSDHFWHCRGSYSKGNEREVKQVQTVREGERMPVTRAAIDVKVGQRVKRERDVNYMSVVRRSRQGKEK